MVRLISHSYHDRTEPRYSGRNSNAARESLIRITEKRNRTQAKKMQKKLAEQSIEEIVSDLVVQERLKETGNYDAFAEAQARIETRYRQLKEFGFGVGEITDLTFESAKKRRDFYEKRRAQTGCHVKGNLKYIERVLQGTSDVQTF